MPNSNSPFAPALSAGVTRRTLIASVGVFFAAPSFSDENHGGEPARGGIADINMKSDRLGAHVWFDPIGLLVAPGTKICWHLRENVHTTTAYHPDNAGHSLRMPEAATPWDSGYLMEPGSSFSVTLTVPGVYDYYCQPHEVAGMVGRIIVGTPSGPGLRPYDYFEHLEPSPDWLPVPEAAQRAFPSIQMIMSNGAVSVL